MDRDPPPRSYVSAMVGLAGLAGLLVWLVVCRNWAALAGSLALPGPRAPLSGDHAARLAVADEGTGIPEAFRERVFQRFAQADGADSRRQGGTGLGLSICKTIVEELGGSIWFDSAEGIGTTFYVELPLAA